MPESAFFPLLVLPRICKGWVVVRYRMPVTCCSSLTARLSRALSPRPPSDNWAGRALRTGHASRVVKAVVEHDTASREDVLGPNPRRYLFQFCIPSRLSTCFEVWLIRLYLNAPMYWHRLYVCESVCCLLWKNTSMRVHLERIDAGLLFLLQEMQPPIHRYAELEPEIAIRA